VRDRRHCSESAVGERGGLNELIVMGCREGASDQEVVRDRQVLDGHDRPTGRVVINRLRNRDTEHRERQMTSSNQPHTNDHSDSRDMSAAPQSGCRGHEARIRNLIDVAQEAFDGRLSVHNSWLSLNCVDPETGLRIRVGHFDERNLWVERPARGVDSTNACCIGSLQPGSEFSESSREQQVEVFKLVAHELTAEVRHEDSLIGQIRERWASLKPWIDVDDSDNWHVSFRMCRVERSWSKSDDLPNTGQHLLRFCSIR